MQLDGGSWTTVSTSPAANGNRTAVVTGLVNDRDYTVRIRAVTAVGNSPSSSLVSVTPTAVVPSAPVGLAVVGSNGSAALTFAPPATNGGSTVTRYEVSLNGGGSWTTLTTTVSGGLHHAGLPGLTNGTTYAVAVRAVNAVGVSPMTATVPVTPAPIAPTAPTGLAVTGSNGSATVSFTAPGDDGGSAVTRYEVSLDGGSAWALLPTTTVSGLQTGTLTGLVNGTTYAVAVRAVNAVGTSPMSGPASVTPAPILPSAPTALTATRGNASATLSFVPGSDGGDAVHFQASTDGSTWLPLVTSPGLGGAVTATLSPLVNGTSYTVQVRPVNTVGNGPVATATTAVVPATTPATPGSFTAERHDRSIAVSFRPGSTGGLTTRYEVSANGTNWTPLTTTPVGDDLTGTVGPLTNGTAYTVQLRATNDVGSSAPVSAAPVTPATLPGAPTLVTATRSDSSALLSFVPGLDGGDAVHFQASTDGDTWVTLTTAPGVAGAVTATLPGLTNGTSYVVQVRAVNTVGNGPVATSLPVVPATTPATPGSFTAQRRDRSIAVSFRPGSTGGLTTRYEVSTNGTDWTPLTTTPVGDDLTGTVGSLTNGTAYTVQLRATNAVGSSTPVSATPVTPATLPAGVTALTATRGDASALLSFVPGSDGGAAATFQASTDGSTWLPLTTTPGLAGAVTASLPGLTNGTSYVVQVRAVNTVGNGPAASSAAVVPATTPATPGSFTAERRDRSIAVSFRPGSTGGLTTRYEVSTNGTDWTPLVTTPVGDDLTGTVGPLTNGTAYTVQLRATNDVGSSAPVSAAPLTPATSPGQPLVVAERGNRLVVLHITVPVSDGGSPITGYELWDGAAFVPVTTVADGPGHVTATITGLTNGVLRSWVVRAVNAVGGSPSASVSVAPATSPSAPAHLTVVRGNGSLALRFAPADDGGSAVTRYEASTDGTSWTLLDTRLVGGDLTATLGGLVNGAGYAVQVRAVNDVAPGAVSTASAVTPATTPAAPALTAQRGNGLAVLTITLPSDDGGDAVTSYEVSTDGDHWSALPTTGSGSTVTATLDGLTNGVPVTYRVRALNGVGAGAATTVTVTPAAAPGTPTGLTATRGDTSLALSFRPAGDGGDPTHFEVSTDGTSWKTLDTVPGVGGLVTASLSGLTNGTAYTVQVRATNSVSSSAPATATATPSTVPSQPHVIAYGGDRQVVLHITVPASDGGSPVTGYELWNGDDYDPLVTVPGAPGEVIATITGLTNGVYRSWVVRAVNAAGPSVSASDDVAPATTPSAPAGLTVLRGDGLLTLSFVVADTGGSALTGYEVSTDGTTWTPLEGQLTGDAVQAVLGGLANGTAYTVSVRALNGVGHGPATTASAVTPATTPSAPAVLAARGDRSAVLTITGAADGGDAVRSYEISTDGEHWAPLATTGTGPTVTATLEGLTNGVTRTYSVRAVNGVGGGAATSVTVTPAAAPGAPTELTATRGNASLALSFRPAGDGGDPARFEVSTDGTRWTALETTPGVGGLLTATLRGLSNGTSYTVQVRATNGVGSSAAATASPVTPATLPGAPAGLTATRTDGGLVLALDPAATGGSQILGYEVSTDGTAWSPLTTLLSGGRLTATVGGLVNGTAYTVRVHALNALGTGPAATAAPATPSTVAGAPTGLTATAGNGLAVLAFTPPASNGGAPVTGYEYSLNAGTTWVALPVTGTTALSATVSGLANGTTYGIVVRAVNAAGGSAASTSASVTPAAPVIGPISAKYAQLGGSAGFLGAPVGPQAAVAGGVVQAYAGGRIYYSAATGAWSVRGAVLDRYLALGGPAGVLGFPTSDETGTSDGIGRFNRFAGTGGASIYWTATTGAHAVLGAIHAHYAAMGYERSVLGYPTSDELVPRSGTGRYTEFSRGGSIYWSAPTGAYSVLGAIRTAWIALGGSASRLGLPVSDEFAVPGGRRSDFAGGSMVYTFATGRTTVTYRR